MAIMKELEDAFISALRGRQEPDLSVLRMLKAALKNKAIELIKKLTEEEAIAVVKSEIKKRQDAIQIYEQGNRPELANKEKLEIEVLKKFLPAQLSQDELSAKVKGIVATLTEEERGNFGQIMKKAMQELQGSADGGAVSQAVKEALAAKT